MGKRKFQLNDRVRIKDCKFTREGRLAGKEGFISGYEPYFYVISLDGEKGGDLLLGEELEKV